MMKEVAVAFEDTIPASTSGSAESPEINKSRCRYSRRNSKSGPPEYKAEC